MQSAIERNKLLSQGIKKFKAELSAPSYKTTTITTELHSLCVIIPEQYDVDVGCVQLNIGKVLVQGRKGYAGMSLKIQLLAVNLSLPVKIADIANTTTTGTNNSTTNTIANLEREELEKQHLDQAIQESRRCYLNTAYNDLETCLLQQYASNIDNVSHNMTSYQLLSVLITAQNSACNHLLNPFLYVEIIIKPIPMTKTYE